MRTDVIDQSVLAVLSAAECKDNALHLGSGQLDRTLYVATNKVLEALGGKWDRKAKAHIFPEPAAPLIDDAILTGRYVRPQSNGFFPTPPALVARVIELAEIAPGMRVLEPSAGTGNIADAVYDFTGIRPDVIELLPANCDVLQAKGYVLAGDDFMAFDGGPYDRVVMNPPFERKQDVAHVRHAWDLLKAGGRLVSIMASGVTFRQDRATAELRALIDEYGSLEHNPAESFKEAGTLVNTVMVTLDKPA